MRGTFEEPPTGLIPWFSKTEGNTYATLLHHPFLFGEIQRSAQEVALCHASDGHVYAKFAGSPYEYIEWSIWVPKTPVTNIRGPITKWVPKTKH